MSGADFSDIPRMSPLVENLIAQDQILIIDPGFGSEQNKLSMPIATSYIKTDSGEPAILVSNSMYAEKLLQVYSIKGVYLGNFVDSSYNQASAITADIDSVYITDDATGTIIKFSNDLHTPHWIVSQKDKKRHTRRIGSLAVDDNYLVAFDIARSIIRIYDKFTGEEISSFGEFLPMKFESAIHENLTPDGKAAFNGHHDIAILGDKIVALNRGIYLEGVLNIPANIKILTFDGKLVSERKISTHLGEIRNVAVDNNRRHIFIGVGNTVQIIGERGLLGSIKVPGCPNKGGLILNLNIDQNSGNLIICHGNINVPEKYVISKGNQTVLGNRDKISTAGYSQIIILTPYAREILMKKTIGSDGFIISGLLGMSKID